MKMDDDRKGENGNINMDLEKIAEELSLLNENMVVLQNRSSPDFNSVIDDLNNIKEENEKITSLNNQLLDEISNIKKENENLINTTQSAIEQLKSLQTDNEELKKKIKQNNKILNSYNEHFRLIFCYSEFKAKGVLKNMQNICQEMLNFVVNVCEKYNLQYWLDVGTLLGAIRHEGFIPWDDDIDMGMMRKDYEIFKEVFNTELKRCGLEKHVKMKLVRHGNNVLYFIQLHYAGFAVLDLFPYDYIENPPEDIEQIYLDERKSFRLKIKEGRDYDEVVNEVMDNLNLSYEPKSHVITSVERPGKGRFKIHETAEMFPLTKAKFNNKEYSILNDYDSHLTQTYGDWRKLPKIIAGHGRINKLEKRPNINEHLEKYIKLLKETNDNF